MSRRLEDRRLTELILAKNAADETTQRYQNLVNDAIRSVGLIANSGALCLTCGAVWLRKHGLECPECEADA